jgi:DNA-directed RNA polymerase subunit RPC12/RpoP
MTYKCSDCEKEFSSARKLIGHKSVHRVGGRYSVSRKKPKNNIVHECVYCSVTFLHRHSSDNKYCSIKCKNDYVWDNITKPRLEKGLGGGGIHRYLKETRGDKCQECGQPSVHNGKPLTLQVDHIDGNSDNDLLDNLRLLCPNCHTQTPTHSRSGPEKKMTKRNIHLRKYRKGL